MTLPPPEEGTVLFFLLWHLADVYALRRATTLMRFTALFTLDKEQITIYIFTIDMGIGWRSTLVAIADDFVRNSFPKTLIKHKVLALKFVG